jgi:hypothetical protein
MNLQQLQPPRRSSKRLLLRSHRYALYSSYCLAIGEIMSTKRPMFVGDRRADVLTPAGEV